MSANMSLHVYVNANRQVVVSLSQDNKTIGHIQMSSEDARTVSDTLLRCADISESKNT